MVPGVDPDCTWFRSGLIRQSQRRAVARSRFGGASGISFAWPGRHISLDPQCGETPACGFAQDIRNGIPKYRTISQELDIRVKRLGV